MTDYGVFFWPRTTFYRLAELDCPYGGLTPPSAAVSGSATAQRWCNVSDNGYFVEWKQPDYDQCSTVDSLSLRASVVSCHGAGGIALPLSSSENVLVGQFLKICNFAPIIP